MKKISWRSIKRWSKQQPLPQLERFSRFVLESMKLGVMTTRCFVGRHRKPLGVGVAGLSFLVLSMSITVPKHHVTIYDDGEIYHRYTAHTESAEILADCDITLAAHDEFALALTPQDSKITVMIKRAFPVSVVADGNTKTFDVTEGTVQELLQKAQLTYTKDDRISLPLDQKLQPDQVVTLQRVTYETIVEKESIPFLEDRPEGKPPKNMKEQVIQVGKPGERTIKKQVIYVDGVKEKTEVVEDNITKQPRTEIVKYVMDHHIGVSQLKYDPDDLPLDENGIPLHYKYKINGKASAYSALGRPTKLVPGCVAMDFSKFPKGTKLYIRTPSGSYVYGYAKVADTGSFVHNGSGILVDLFFNSYAESARFGIKNVDVYVLE